jgi:uronate dehydrogenase
VLLPKNLDGTWAVYEAAVLARVPRFVFASTVQTVEGFRPGVVAVPEDPPRPVSVYSCTKLFGEALGRFHADRSGLGVACLRLGAVREPDDPKLAAGGSIRDLWLGADDLAALMIAAVRSEVPFATVIAVSPPATARFDTTNPFDWAPAQTPSTGV